MALHEQGESVVLGGEVGPAFPSVDPPSFGKTPEAWGYLGRDSAQSTVVMGGEVLDSHGWAGNLVFSPDGRRYAYLVRNDDVDVIVHDRGIEEFDMVVDGTLQFVARGERWACLAGELKGRRLFVTVEGEEEVRPFEWSEFGGVTRSRTATAVTSRDHLGSASCLGSSGISGDPDRWRLSRRRILKAALTNSS